MPTPGGVSLADYGLPSVHKQLHVVATCEGLRSAPDHLPGPLVLMALAPLDTCAPVKDLCPLERRCERQPTPGDPHSQAVRPGTRGA